MNTVIIINIILKLQIKKSIKIFQALKTKMINCLKSKKKIVIYVI